MTRWVERSLRRLSVRERRGESSGLWDFYRRYVAGAAAHARPDIARRPATMLGKRILVVKSPADREKGVIVVDYSYVFPLFAAFFDLAAIAERYYIVLEPSWRGLCSEDLLALTCHFSPVFVEAIEPRDTAFLRAVDDHVVVVPTAANWWVDYRKLVGYEPERRDIDVIMIAGWYDLKRHWRFFRVLADLRQRGSRLSVTLVGYPQGLTKQDIEADARAFGVLDQLTILDSISGDEVGRLLQRSKVSVLWSRKEGANRSIIEALFADVPVIVREGLSYGHQYPYINRQTGRFSSERALGTTILEILATRSTFQPREWAMRNMTCQKATEILSATIGEAATREGMAWTGGLATKVVMLDAQAYWDPGDAKRFADDYAFIERCARGGTEAADRAAQLTT